MKGALSTRLSTAIMPATHAGAAGAIACAHAAGRGPPLCAKALRFCTCSCTMRGTGQAVAPVRSQESCRMVAELTATAVWTIRSGCGPNAVSRSVLSAVSHTVVRRPSGATAGLITVEFNYELSYITTESLISIHPLAPLTRWYHAVCAQSAYSDRT